MGLAEAEVGAGAAGVVGVLWGGGKWKRWLKMKIFIWCLQISEKRKNTMNEIKEENT